MRIDPTSLVPPPSREHLEWFERVYRVELPRSYRDFIQTWNGGVPIGGAAIEREGLSRVVERFLPMLKDPNGAGTLGWYDIGVVLTQIEDRLIDGDELIGTNIVPIAALFAGDFLCLDFRTAGTEPSVVVWDHEASGEGAPVAHHVSSTFKDFLFMVGFEASIPS